MNLILLMIVSYYLNELRHGKEVPVSQGEARFPETANGVPPRSHSPAVLPHQFGPKWQRRPAGFIKPIIRQRLAKSTNAQHIDPGSDPLTAENNQIE
jgi:hypothetical protein